MVLTRGPLYRETSFQVLRYGILGGAIICSAYAIIEFLYLFGSYDAMTILAHINLSIYDVGIDHGWWPPLLGGNRVRSVFAEPAFMALYLTVTIPFLFAQIYTAKTKKWFWKIGECKIVCVNRYCMNLLYAPYWGKQR